MPTPYMESDFADTFWTLSLSRHDAAGDIKALKTMVQRKRDGTKS